MTMRTRQLERLFLFSTPDSWSTSRIDQTARCLRIAGLWPKTGRGLNAAEVKEKHAARLLVALASGTPGSAVKMAEYFSEVLPEPRKLDFTGSGHFLLTLETLLSSPARSKKIVDVTIVRSWPPYASIRYRSGPGKTVETTRYSHPEYGPRDAPIREETVLSGSFLGLLAQELASPGDHDSIRRETGPKPQMKDVLPKSNSDPMIRDSHSVRI